MAEKRVRTDTFQKVLLVVGFSVLILGYFMINNMFQAEGRIISWEFLQTTFLWLLMVIFIIFLSISEDMKTSMIQEQTDEIKLLREVLTKKKKKS